MPHPSTNTNSSEIKLFYKTYGEKSSKPHDAILFNPDRDQKFREDVFDNLVDKGLWDESLEKQLENKQLYFKVFREDEDMIPADAVMFENVRLLPNQGLLSLEESLQNKISSSFSWFGSFIPERVNQTAFSLGNSLAQWTEDKLSGFSAYSGIPAVEKMDEEIWHEIVDENSDESEIVGRIKQSGSDKTIKKDVGSVATLLDPTYEKMKRDEKNETDFTSKSLAESLLNTAWSFAHYAYQLVASFKLTVSKEKYFWNYFLFTQNKSELFEKIIHKFFYFLSFLKKRQQNSITNVYVQKIFVVKFMRSRNAVNLSTYKLLISYQNGFDLFFQIVRVNV